MLRYSGGHCSWWSHGSVWFNVSNSGYSSPPAVVSVIRSDSIIFVHVCSGSLSLLRLSEQRKLWAQTSLRQQLHPCWGETLTFLWVFTQTYERHTILWVKQLIFWIKQLNFWTKKNVKILVIFNSQCPHEEKGNRNHVLRLFSLVFLGFFPLSFENLLWDKEIYDVTLTKL